MPPVKPAPAAVSSPLWRRRIRALRRLLVATVALGALTSSRVAAAAVSIVMDPSPPFSGSLVVGDFTEPAPGVNETYKFSGEARNDAPAAMRLFVVARANGVDVSGSQQTFTLAGNATTSLNYTFTDPGPSPATVGLDLEAPDGTVSFVAGSFDAGPVALVPATGTAAIAALMTILMLLGLRLCVRRPLWDR